MNEQSSRETVVGAIRRALAGPREQRVDLRPAAFGSPAGRSLPELVERFVARAEAADAFVSIAANYSGALQRVADILFELDARQAIVSDDAWQMPWEIGRLSEVIEDCAIRPTSSLHDTSYTSLARFAYVGVTTAAWAVADTGSILICSGQEGGRIESLLPPVHIVLLRSSAIAPGLPDVFAALSREERFGRSSAVIFITGPSRTADIELTLTIGVHGPKQLYIVLINS